MINGKYEYSEIEEVIDTLFCGLKDGEIYDLDYVNYFVDNYDIFFMKGCHHFDDIIADSDYRKGTSYSKGHVKILKIDNGKKEKYWYWMFDLTNKVNEALKFLKPRPVKYIDIVNMSKTEFSQKIQNYVEWATRNDRNHFEIPIVLDELQIVFKKSLENNRWKIEIQELERPKNKEYVRFNFDSWIWESKKTNEYIDLSDADINEICDYSYQYLKDYLEKNPPTKKELNDGFEIEE